MPFSKTAPRLLFTVLIFLCCFSGIAQSKYEKLLANSDTLSKPRRNILYIGMGATTAATLTGLHYLWYSDYEQSSLHFINDNAGWMQIDKYGHAMNTYLWANWVRKSFLWAGIEHKKANRLAVIPISIYMMGVELLDGHSAHWGFSWTDVAANTAGVGFSFLQDHLWKEQRIWLKFSFSPPDYGGLPVAAQERATSEFGEAISQQFLKDYNGQTYWASVNVSSFLAEGNRFPKWLNFAVGYGAENMLGANSNTWTVTENGEKVSYSFDQTIPRYRQYYFSPDIDLSRIKTKSRVLKTLLYLANGLKVPAPALEYNTENGWDFHFLFF